MKEADLFIKMLSDFSGADVSLVLAFISGLQTGRKISVSPVLPVAEPLPETETAALAEPSVASSPTYRLVLNVPEIGLKGFAD